jgi:hypothetical protein
MFMTFGFTFFFMPRCCSSSSRALSFSWPISTLLKSYYDPAWPHRLFARAQSSAKRPNDGQFPHSLALLCDPLVLPLEVRRSGDVASPFLRERLQVVLELFDRDLRVGGRLLLGLDHLVEIAQLRVETRQRRTLFPQTALCPAVLLLSSCDLRAWDQRGAWVSEVEGVCTHLALRDFVREGFELLARLVDPGRGIG